MRDSVYSIAEDGFRITPDSEKKYYKKKDYLTITSKVAHVGGSDVIYFSAKILSEKAYKYYGSLRSGGEVMLRLKNGEMITLKFLTTDYGEANYDYNYTTYSNYCYVDSDQLESLKSSEVDKVRIYWSEGYENYDCSNNSIYINQLPCLNK